ncbi:MAG: two-component regulator propeller domain-containing protein [Rikenellaceae bacterium]
MRLSDPATTGAIGRWRRTILLSILSLCSCIHMVNASPYRMFGSINIEQGLPDNGVTSLYKDSRGYIWIGTYDGLVRYSNSLLTTYSNTLEDKIFRSNRIRSICEDRKGDIWIGTDNGVTLYKYEQQQFVNLEYNKNQDPIKGCVVREILISQDGQYIYCLTEQNGVLVYNSDAELLRQVTLDSRLYFQSAIHVSDENYLFGSNQGLILYDFTNGDMERIYKRSDYNVATPASLMRESDSTILYGSIGGILRIKIRHAQDNVVELKVGDKTYYPNRVIKSICKDADNQIVIGMVSTGAYRVSTLGDLLTPIVEHRRISTLLPLSSGELWIGSFDDGIILFDSKQSPFHEFDTSYFDRSILRTTQICPYDDQHILYRHNFFDLALFNVASGKHVPLPKALKIAEQERSYLKYIHNRPNGDMCLLFQSATSSWWRIIKQGESKNSRIETPILSKYKIGNTIGIVEDHHGYIWLATNETILRLKIDDNLQIQEVERVDNHKIFKEYICRFRTIYIDPQHDSRLYIGTSNAGLYIVDISSSSLSVEQLPIEAYRENSEIDSSISSNFISSIIRNPNGALWVGTEQGGICCVEESDQGLKFNAYGISKGLAHNSVKSILSDSDGKIWVATNNGLSYYDEHQDRFHSYYRAQGVPFSTFDYPAMMFNEHLFFSSASNVCYFDPHELPIDDKVPPIYFDKLKLYDQIILPGKEYGGRIILDSALKSSDHITLKHDEKHFSIGIDVMSTHMQHSHMLQYRLLPISNKWSNLTKMSEELSFRGLKAGDYELQVRVANSINEFGEIERLYIKVKNPIWLSLWAKMVYLLLIITTIVAIVISLMRMQRLRYQLHIEALSKHNLESMNAERMRYFSNMSHEIKTPLTLIMAPIVALQSRFSSDGDVSKKLSLVKRQAQKIYELVELMHGVQLNDSNLLKRTDSEFVMEDMLKEICADFEHVTSLDNKKLSLECSDPRFMVCADRSMIEKIIDNLVSNSIKHTAAQDSITVRCSTEANTVTIEVEDTGYGIAPTDLPHLFERFFRAQDRRGNKAGGTGIGLYFSKILTELHEGQIEARSQLDQGSTFIVRLPIIVDTAAPEPQAEVASGAALTCDNLTVDGSIESIEPEIQELFESIRGSVVYVVEDNAEMRSIIVDFLSNGLSVKGFNNGSEALEALEDQWPDIIISDVMMPQMDGYELCKRVKEDTKTSHIPVILLTACATIDEKIKGLNSGADSYIPKPFYTKHLLTRISTLLNSRQRLRERFQIGIPLNYGKNSNTSAKDNEFMAKLYELFNEHLSDEEICLNDIALELGQSRSMFFKKVKAITNSSPFELLKEYRLKRAAELLQDGEHNVNEVCMMTGFKDRSHFSRLFKEKYSMSPSKWREQLQTDDK